MQIFFNGFCSDCAFFIHRPIQDDGVGYLVRHRLPLTSLDAIMSLGVMRGSFMCENLGRFM